MNQCSRGAIEPNLGIVDVPDTHLEMASQAADFQSKAPWPRSFLSSFCPEGKLLIVLISEAMLQRASVSDGRILRDRVLSGFGVRLALKYLQLEEPHRNQCRKRCATSGTCSPISNCQMWAAMPSSGSRAAPNMISWPIMTISAVIDITTGSQAVGSRRIFLINSKSRFTIYPFRGLVSQSLWRRLQNLAHKTQRNAIQHQDLVRARGSNSNGALPGWSKWS